MLAGQLPDDADGRCRIEVGSPKSEVELGVRLDVGTRVHNLAVAGTSAFIAACLRACARGGRREPATLPRKFEHAVDDGDHCRRGGANDFGRRAIDATSVSRSRISR